MPANATAYWACADICWGHLLGASAGGCRGHLLAPIGSVLTIKLTLTLRWQGELYHKMLHQAELFSWLEEDMEMWISDFIEALTLTITFTLPNTNPTPTELLPVLCARVAARLLQQGAGGYLHSPCDSPSQAK